MFKRLFWMTIGAGFGFGMSFWVARVVRQTAARYAPQRLQSDAAVAIRGFGADLRAAVEEGRSAMQEREQELRRQLEA